MSWCNEALCWYREKETALLMEFSLTKSSWSGVGDCLGMDVCTCVRMCVQALFLMGKLRPNCPLHCLTPPDGFLKWLVDSKSIPVCRLFFFFSP